MSTNITEISRNVPLARLSHLTASVKRDIDNKGSVIKTTLQRNFLVTGSRFCESCLSNCKFIAGSKIWKAERRISVACNEHPTNYCDQ